MRFLSIIISNETGTIRIRQTKMVDEMKFIQAKNRYQAKKMAGSFATIAKVNGGFMVFDSRNDYQIWKNQK